MRLRRRSGKAASRVRSGFAVAEHAAAQMAAKGFTIPACGLPEVLASARERVLAIAAADGATRVCVFGSALKGSDRADSDLGLLIDVRPGTSFLRIVGMKLAMEDALGVRVDLCTEREPHPALRERIPPEGHPL